MAYPRSWRRAAGAALARYHDTVIPRDHDTTARQCQDARTRQKGGHESTPKPTGAPRPCSATEQLDRPTETWVPKKGTQKRVVRPRHKMTTIFCLFPGAQICLCSVIAGRDLPVHRCCVSGAPSRSPPLGWGPLCGGPVHERQALVFRRGDGRRHGQAERRARAPRRYQARCRR